MRDKYCVLQDDMSDCGVSCLLSIIKYYGGYVPREYLKEITKTNKNGVNALNLVKAARELGFESFGIKGKLKNVKKEYLPVIAHVLINKKINHFVVIYKIDMKKNQVLLMDPSKGYISLSFTEFTKISTNYFLIMKPRQTIPKLEDNKNDIITLVKAFMNKYKTIFTSIIFMSFIFTVLNILSSYNFKFLYDDARSINIDLQMILVMLILFIIFKEILNYFRSYLINYLNVILDKKLVKDTYYHIINLPYLYYKNHTNGDLLTRINDLSNVKEFISHLIVNVFVDLLLALLILIIMLKINVTLSLITIFSLIIYTLIVLITNQCIKDKVGDSIFNSGLVNNYLIESLASFETIKNLSIQDYVSKKFNYKYDNYSDINRQLLTTINKETFFKRIILSISNLIVIYLGIGLINKNILTVTSLITFISLSDYLTEPIKNLLDLHFVYLESRESIRRIKEIYNIPEEKLLYNDKRKIKDLNGEIVIDNLSYSYNGKSDVIKNVSLNIREGEKVLIYGDSGSGKSTLIKILIRYLDNAYKGDITINGFNLNDIDLMSLRENICYVSQNEFLYTDSVYENITLGRKIKYKDFLSLAKNLLIDEIVEKSSIGYDYLIENNGENVSGGEKARIILARSIVKNANIYILDESFSALDIPKERKILEYIFNLYSNKTFIVISHRKSNIDLYDSKFRVEEGCYVREENESHE